MPYSSGPAGSGLSAMSLLISYSRAKAFQILGGCLEGSTKKDGDTNSSMSTPGLGDSPAALQITTDIAVAEPTAP